MSRTSLNQFSKPLENNASFLRRFWLYQKERFPLLAHGLLISVFSFSAIAYSRICRGENGFIDVSIFGAGVFTTITLFLLVRIFDEFKDAEDDAKYRPNLPVPRGLISLHELKITGIVVAGLQVIVNVWLFPKMLILYLIVVVYLSLMGKEFFVPEWLKKHQFWYVTSHMFIIPLVDIYASGLDWFLPGEKAPAGLLFFFAVSYMNGIVLEVGRKIRTPEKEQHGVLTYTSMLGANKAIFLWILILLVTLVLSIIATLYANHNSFSVLVLVIAFVLCLIPAIAFLRKKNEKTSRAVEISSALWTITMYLVLGGVPMLLELIGQ